jgi:leucine-rich repeat/coiled-coil domain-containing protein 1
MNEKERNLSMIDCGIKSMRDIAMNINLISLNFHSNSITKIENLTFLQNLVHLDLSSNKIKSIDGLDGLVSLKTLNLSCNLITTIENLESLKSLVWLNISFNKINSAAGLADLWGNDFSLETLLLHANFLNSTEEIIYYLSGLKHLKHLTLNENKFPGSYRPFILSKVKHLTSLDGRDRGNKAVKYDLKCLNAPLLSEFVDESLSFDFLNSYNYEEDESNLDTAENELKTRSKIKKEFKKLDSILSKQSTKANKKTNGLNVKLVDSEPKLEMIEEKIHELLELRNTIRKIGTRNSNSSDGEDEPHTVKSPMTNKLKPFKTSDEPLRLEGQTKPIVGILKTTNQSDSNNKMSSSEFKLNEFVQFMHKQLNEYKEANENNSKLIIELKSDLEACKVEKLKYLNERDEFKTRAAFESDTFTKKIDELKKTIDEMQSKLVESSQEDKNASAKDERVKQLEQKHKEELELLKKQTKKHYQAEIKKLNQSNERLLKEYVDKLESSERNYKLLEDEFRSALIIESSRYNDLCNKLEEITKENTLLKVNVTKLEQEEKRSKDLVKELNQLIKEQKARLQVFSQIRKDTTEDIHKRNEKLSEAVADCVKLRAQIEQLKKEKKEMEIALKNVLPEFEEIKKERDTWSKKLNDQKNFLMQENNRLDIENQNFHAQTELLQKQLEKEVDNVKIKTKIVEDQTETIKKLKAALLERDELLKKCREDALSTQKSLEKQLNDEMDLSNELQLKLEKANLQREELREELENVKDDSERTKLAFNELSEKWKQKSELITQLDLKVRKMKDDYEVKEKELVNEKNQLIEKNNQLIENMRKIDDEFRNQYDVEKREHLKQMQKQKSEYEQKLSEADTKIIRIEDEMRQILLESANKKKFYEDKINSFSIMFNKIQADILSEPT